MRRSIFPALALVLALLAPLPASVSVARSSITVGAPQPLDLETGTWGYAETPPWVAYSATAGQRNYGVSTAWSVLCATTANLLTGPVVTTAASCPELTSPANDDPLGAGYRSPAADYSLQLWRKEHYGATQGVIVNVAGSPGPLLLAATHGENKNEAAGGYLYQSEINADVPAATCASGYSGSPPAYQECWPAYSAFVGMSADRLDASGHVDPSALADLGPVVWPRYGYLDASGHKASYGVRHPSFTTNGTAIYLYYLDTGPFDASGHPTSNGCIRVARSIMGPDGLPGAFKAFSGGTFSAAELPPGYNRSTTREFLSAQGPASDCILPDNDGAIRFSVARLLNSASGAWVGVEETTDSAGWHLLLRFSTDALHWGAPTEIASAASWAAAQLHYPIFSSADGNWNTVVDGAGAFYVLGTDGAGHVQALPVTLS